MQTNNDKDNLATLILGCRQNDRFAQNELYKVMYRFVFGICSRYASEENAKEITQDVFYKIFTKINKYGGESSFYSWIKRITINTCIDRYRSKINDIVTTDLEEAIFSTELASSIMDADADYLLQFIQKLPNAYRITFSLYAIDGFKYEEIADTLNISLGTVKSNISKARGHLQKMLENSPKNNNH